MIPPAPPLPYALEIATSDALWDTWVLAEMAAELALFLWRTVPVAERAEAYEEYLARAEDEERAAELLSARLARES
jgi:hypothetical protein